MMIVIILTLIMGLSEGRPKSWREGPIVDPGVFVITHIKDCRNGAGYCILGTNCSVDNDFIPDDLGGHCRGLSSGFSPQASFVCCRQNPANFEDSEDDTLEAIIIEHNIEQASPSDDSKTTRITTTTTKPTTETVTDKFNEISSDAITEIEEVSQAVSTETTMEESSTNMSILDSDSDMMKDKMDLMNTPKDKIIDKSDVINTPENNMLDKMDLTDNPDDTAIDRMDVINIAENTMIDRMDIMSTPEEFAEVSDDSWSDSSDFYSSSPQIDSGRYNGQGLGIPEVYEIEIGQTITQGESGPKVDILKPGLVIDDTENFVQSIVQKDFLDVQTNFEEYSNSPVSSVENIELKYSQNENLKDQVKVENVSNISGVAYEMIGLDDAIANPEIDTNYVHEKYDDNVYVDQSYDSVSDLNKYGTELEEIPTTEASKENEYEPDCDFSIFWGISCSYPFDS